MGPAEAPPSLAERARGAAERRSRRDDGGRGGCPWVDALRAGTPRLAELEAQRPAPRERRHPGGGLVRRRGRALGGRPRVQPRPWRGAPACPGPDAADWRDAPATP